MSKRDDNGSEIAAATAQRFGEQIEIDPSTPGIDEILRMIEHCSHREWSERAVEPKLLRVLFASALSAPSKSDLQQTDIIHVIEPSGKRSWIRSMTWTGS